MAAFGKAIFDRVFTHMDVAGLLGGAVSFILDIFIVDHYPHICSPDTTYSQQLALSLVFP